MKKMLKSKKFRVFVLGCITVFLKEVIGLDEASSTQLVALASTYIIGQGIADLGKEVK